MKILSTQQIREADAFTILNEPVSSLDLMERVAGKCSDWLVKKFGEENCYVFFCGNGNNGGDGLVIARLFSQMGIDVKIFVLKVAQNDSADFSENLMRLKKNKIVFTEISDVKEIHFPINKSIVIVDAIFGSGLSREPEGLAAHVIDKMNRVNAVKVAIDIPSGLFGDDNSKNSCAHVVHANYTLTFQQPKLSFLFPEYFPFVGEFHILDIGLHENYLEQAQTGYNYITHDFAKQLLKPRGKFSHKGTFGHALMVAGSKGKIGAAVLASKACLHSGVGLLTVCVPKCGNDILQISVPEAMTMENEGENYISGRIPTGVNKSSNFSAIGIGPGIGTEKETENAIKLLLNELNSALVLDADAINILAENKSWLAFLPHGTILTPHPGEFDRLTEKHKTSAERLKAQQELSIKFGIYIVLKGAHTSIACPDGNVFFNSSGNAGMATGGSGDVLTGIITSFRAQGYDPQSACILGVYAHGLAGDIAAAVQTQYAMSSGDIVENLPGAFRMLEEQ